ncbi:MAG: hypothetical protein MPJ50_16900 [Pirellulales bacterium]|nr:hypothetical protein [Pirellulales bacterium]
MHDISFLAKLTILLVVLAIVVFGPPVNAQLVPHDSFDGQLDDVFLMPDRSRLLWMRRAEDMIAEQQYSNAVRLLAQILDSDSDYFVRGPDGATFTSFKRRAEQMIGALPEKGREAYISLFGAVADRQLTEAVTSSEIQGLVECSRRYFHTEAGAKATWLLGLHYIDHGQPLTAVTVLRRLQRNAAAGQLEPKLSLTLTLALRRAGLDKPARDAAGEMRLRFPDARFDVQGQSIPIFANEKRAFDWLAGIGGMPVRHATGPQVESWLPQGNASGTPTFDADRPVSIARWSLPVAESRETDCSSGDGTRHT